jgi:hypothetical protein
VSGHAFAPPYHFSAMAHGNIFHALQEEADLANEDLQRHLAIRQETRQAERVAMAMELKAKAAEYDKCEALRLAKQNEVAVAAAVQVTQDLEWERLRKIAVKRCNGYMNPPSGLGFPPFPLLTFFSTRFSPLSLQRCLNITTLFAFSCVFRHVCFSTLLRSISRCGRAVM